MDGRSTPGFTDGLVDRVDAACSDEEVEIEKVASLGIRVDVSDEDPDPEAETETEQLASGTKK